MTNENGRLDRIERQLTRIEANQRRLLRAIEYLYDLSKTLKKENVEQQRALQMLIGRGPKRPKPDTGSLVEAQHRRWAARLARLINRHFSREELRLLCADLEMDYENIENGGKRLVVLRLVKRFGRLDLLDVLAEQCRRVRPNVVWPLDPVLLDVSDIDVP